MLFLHASNIAFMFLLLLFYILAPAGVIWLCRKASFFNKIGPILILYILGVIVGNLPIITNDAHELQSFLSSAIIPIAIPMMLFSSNFKNFSVKKVAFALVCGLVAVVISVVVGFLIFKNNLGEEGYKIGGMLTGSYTGGTPNIAALKLMLDVQEETYLLVNTYDMVVCFLYLLFLMGAGIKLFRRLLPKTGITATGMASQHKGKGEYHQEADPYVGILTKANLIQIAKALALSLLILGISVGVAMLVGENAFMVVVILCLTTLGIVASFFAPIRKLDKSYDAGMYLIYIFSIVVASMADIDNLDFAGSIWLLLYLFLAVFVSLVLQALFSKLCRVDADTMTISSVALINSPPFVPMIAASMKNRDAVIPGLTVGIIGYAVGNYLGFLVAEFLQYIS